MICETLHIPLAIAGEGSIHVCMDEIPTITIYSRGHAGETDILQQHGLSRSDVEHALARYSALHDLEPCILLGVSDFAVFFTFSEEWDPTKHNDSEVRLLFWDVIHMLLGIKP